ncbi:hypothetical protein LB467_17940 [Salegentibacter sp. JZCK2]|uniref:hypothetical protein n=1 Tax=Salegentibacter tibetensis TaxID=2873600 RepID=UPI001CC99F8A|nr:hypothetical protein [Salegentibacter tibetensis]MBZ9731571.1 hypothetical protein [Salegentibacter tibetensis]
MKECLTTKRLFFLCIVLFFCSCGENIKYIEETNITDEVSLESHECTKEKFFFILEKISIWNTKQDTFVVRSHTPLGINLKLKVINNDNKPKKIIINNGEMENCNFHWKVDKTEIEFFGTTDKSLYIVKPKDSLSLNLHTLYFNFDKIFGPLEDYTEVIKNLISEFSLTYDDVDDKICIEQGAKTEIVIYNHKSRWEWWR